MKTRNLQELLREHQKNYPGFKQNFELSRELSNKYFESKQHYIFSVSYLLKDFGAYSDFMGISPLNLESLTTIENKMLKMSGKISQGCYDDFSCSEDSDKNPFKQLGKIKCDIENFSDNIELMQLFIDAETRNPALYEKIAQFVFADDGAKPLPLHGSSPGNPADLIEAKIALYNVNKEILQQKIEQLRGLCQQLGEDLLVRTVKRDATDEFHEAVYQEREEEEEIVQLSVAPHATRFGASATRIESAPIEIPTPGSRISLYNNNSS